MKNSRSKKSSRRNFIQKISLAGLGLTSSCITSQPESSGNGKLKQYGVLNDQSKKLMKMFHLKYPIIQAPTAGPAGNELAIAVAEAGAMGALPLTWRSITGAIQSVKDVKLQTSRTFYANYVLSLPPKSLGGVLDEGINAIQFSWGLPTNNMVDQIKSRDIKLGIQVTSKENAKKALEFDPDYLVCQGTEAGGHVQATKKLAIAFEEILDVADEIPVAVSGGISTGHDIRNWINKGAAAAVLGTRFVATRESYAHDDYKKAILNSKENSTVMSACFYKSGFNNRSALHRVIRNNTFNMWETAGCPPEGQRPGEKDIIAKFIDGDNIERYEDFPPVQIMEGNVKDLAMYAGEGVININDIPAAGDLIRRLWEEFENKG